MKNVSLFFGVSVLIFCSSFAHAAAEDDMGLAEANYQGYCSPCHGHNGDGHGDLEASMDSPPRDHTDASIMSERTDEEIFKTISLGGEVMGLSSEMPAHNTIISEAEIRGLVKKIRQLCNCRYHKPGGK